MQERVPNYKFTQNQLYGCWRRTVGQSVKCLKGLPAKLPKIVRWCGANKRCESSLIAIWHGRTAGTTAKTRVLENLSMLDELGVATIKPRECIKPTFDASMACIEERKARAGVKAR